MSWYSYIARLTKIVSEVSGCSFLNIIYQHQSKMLELNANHRVRMYFELNSINKSTATFNRSCFDQSSLQHVAATSKCCNFSVSTNPQREGGHSSLVPGLPLFRRMPANHQQWSGKGGLTSLLWRSWPNIQPQSRNWRELWMQKIPG